MNLPAVVPRASGLAINTGPTVLGERLARIPVGGRIRSGIKVLTSDAVKNEQARRIYETGVQAGKKWSEIEKQLIEQCKFQKSPLTPRNVPYFSLFRADFSMPEIADRIMELYGEDRGDGVRRLYRFPVILPFDYWQANLPHSLRVFSRSGLKYWSEYDRQGIRHCMTYAHVAQGQKRVFGGRATALRRDNDGICNPEKCGEYQRGECKLSGGLLCYVPGIPGASCLEVPSTSFYSMQGMRQRMEMVLSIRGRISGTEGGQPVFWLTKAQEEVSMIEAGQPKKVKQWIVKLEANVDMTKLFAAHEPPALLETGARAAAALTGQVNDPEVEDTDHSEIIEGTGTGADTDHTAGDPATDDGGTEGPSVAELRQQVIGKMNDLGIIGEELAAYGDRVFGAGWGQDASKLIQARDMLNEAETNPTLFAKIKTARVPF